MAIISSYPSDNNIQPGDSWASSDAGTRRTRKISVSGLADYLNSYHRFLVAQSLQSNASDQSPNLKDSFLFSVSNSS